MCFLFTSLGFAKEAHASCDVGHIIFKDVLYGTAIGAGVGTLFLLANSQSSNIIANIATSALIGGGVGGVVGVVEIAYTNTCSTHDKKKHEDEDFVFTIKPMIQIVQNKDPQTSSLTQTLKLPLHKLGAGFTFEYALN